MVELSRTPNPPGSPNEKLITQTPLESVEDYIRGKLGGGPVTNEELIEVFRFYNEKVQEDFRKQNRDMELWANIHTHPGGGGPSGTTPLRTWEPLTIQGIDPEPSMVYNPDRDSLIIHTGQVGGEFWEFNPDTVSWNLITSYTSSAARIPVGSYGNKAWVHDFNTDWEQVDIPTGTSDGTVATVPFSQDQMESSAQVDGRVYVSGRTTGFAVYDPSLGSFTSLASMPEHLCGIEGCSLLGVVVGIASSTGKTPYVYDIATNTWSSALTLGTYNHNDCAMAVAGKYLHLFGGSAAAQWSEYDIENDTWVVDLDMDDSGNGPGSTSTNVASAAGRNEEEIYFVKPNRMWKLRA